MIAIRGSHNGKPYEAKILGLAHTHPALFTSCLPRYSPCRMGWDLLQWPAEHTYGVLAHLVERFHGMEEVGGSNPPYSTIIAQLTALGYKPKAVLYGI